MPNASLSSLTVICAGAAVPQIKPDGGLDIDCIVYLHDKG